MPAITYGLDTTTLRITVKKINIVVGVKSHGITT